MACLWPVNCQHIIIHSSQSNNRSAHCFKYLPFITVISGSIDAPAGVVFSSPPCPSPSSHFGQLNQESNVNIPLSLAIGSDGGILDSSFHTDRY